MARLQDKVVIVTGGAQGLGEGIARRVAEEGASLMIADINGAKAQSVADSLVREGRQAIAVMLDVAERKQMRDAVQKIVEHFGRLDVMFNNAGFNRPLPFIDVDEDNFNSIMRVNAFGVLVDTQEAARQMMAQGGGGKIINTASIAGRQGYAEFAPYCASKASVISLTQAGAREFAKHRITVNRLRRVLWLRRFGMASNRTCSTKALSRRRANSSSRSHPASCWAFRRSSGSGRDRGFSRLRGLRLYNRTSHHGGRGHGARLLMERRGGQRPSAPAATFPGPCVGWDSKALFAKPLHPGIAQRLAGKAWAQNAGDLVMRRALYA